MKAVFALCLVALCAVGLGQEKKDDKLAPVNPDRPDQTNGAGITPIGKFVLEMGYRQTRTQGISLHEWGDQPTLRYGINDRFEARVVGPVRAISTAGNGWEDSGFGFKWLLKDGGDGGGFKKPSYALQGGTNVPTGSSQFGSRKILPALTGIVDFDLGANGDLGVNVGGSTSTNGLGKEFLVWSATVSYNHSLAGPLAGFLEGYMLVPTAHNGGTLHFADTGLQYLLSNDCMLDAFVGSRVDQHQQNSFFGAGVSFRF